ncbi:hypothetical protein Tco_0485217, partial [Tanacetum coccineum]
VRTTLEAKKTWWLRLGAGVYDSWKLQGDVEELWDELAKLGLVGANTKIIVPITNCLKVECWDDVRDFIKDDEIVKDMKEQLDKLTGRDKEKQTGASCTQGAVSSIPIVGSISPEGFLSLILLLVVIIAMVVVTVVVVVAIVGVVIVVAVIGVVVVVGGVSFIIKLSFMVIGYLYRIVFHYLLY